MEDESKESYRTVYITNGQVNQIVETAELFSVNLPIIKSTNQ